MIPRDPAFDNTLAFFREGYDFVGNHCRQIESDAFETRLMLRRVVCMMGEEAARHFHDGASFTRAGAMPQTTLRLLQDKGSVQTLDGARHARRKRMFLDLMTKPHAIALTRSFEGHLDRALAAGRSSGRIVLHIDGVGSVGPRAWRALLLRRRAERWARAQIKSARSSGHSDDTPLAAIAHFRDGLGALLDERSAGVELLNIRPIVAVSRFTTFASDSCNAKIEGVASSFI